MTRQMYLLFLVLPVGFGDAFVLPDRTIPSINSCFSISRISGSALFSKKPSPSEKEKSTTTKDNDEDDSKSISGILDVATSALEGLNQKDFLGDNDDDDDDDDDEPSEIRTEHIIDNKPQESKPTEDSNSNALFDATSKIFGSDDTDDNEEDDEDKSKNDFWKNLIWSKDNDEDESTEKLAKNKKNKKNTFNDIFLNLHSKDTNIKNPMDTFEQTGKSLMDLITKANVEESIDGILTKRHKISIWVTTNRKR